MPTEAPETQLLVTVEARHLRPETRYHCKECPVAVAIQEAVAQQCGVDCQVIAGGFHYFLFLPGIRAHQGQGELPMSAREFIEHFDLRGIGEPFSFYLPKPEFGTAEAPGAI